MQQGLVTVNEGRADDLLVGLRGLLGGIHLKDTRDKVHRGMQGVVRDGRSAGGRAYGCRPAPSRTEALEIVEHEAEVVRRIHALHLDGHGPKAIAGALNRDGVLPPRGTKWSASTINGSPKRGYALLSNPLYDGRQVWNRVGMVRDPDTGRRVSRDNESPRLSRRPRLLEGWGSWEPRGRERRTRPSCASGRCGWCASTRVSTRRGPRRCARWPARWAVTARRCGGASALRQAERDDGVRAGPTSEEKARIRELERENRELRQANEILRKASAYFAMAEFDRPLKR